MSKFIRLTLRDQEIFVNAEQIEYIKPFADGSIRSIVGSHCELHQVTETPAQILAMIEGGDLKERVAFLERALNGLIEGGELRVEGNRVLGRTDEGLTFTAASKGKNPELLAYMTEPKAVKS